MVIYFDIIAFVTVFAGSISYKLGKNLQFVVQCCVLTCFLVTFVEVKKKLQTLQVQLVTQCCPQTCLLVTFVALKKKLQTVQVKLNTQCCVLTCFLVTFVALKKKSCIRKTPTLSNDADSRTDTNLKRNAIFELFQTTPYLALNISNL